MTNSPWPIFNHLHRGKSRPGRGSAKTAAIYLGVFGELEDEPGPAEPFA